LPATLFAGIDVSVCAAHRVIGDFARAEAVVAARGVLRRAGGADVCGELDEGGGDIDGPEQRGRGPRPCDVGHEPDPLDVVDFDDTHGGDIDGDT
jgi:hypothetical protein